MNRPSEFRTLADIRAQAELERMLAARRARDAMREERYRRLPTPRHAQRTPATPPKPPALAGWKVVAIALAWALCFGATLWLAAHDAGFLSRTVECAIGERA